MKITNVRVLNNYKVKLINAKLSGVNTSQNIVSEQGTRTPVIITETPTQEFQEKFDRVFNYLINRYEPGWSAATVDLGRAATMQLLGVSAAINPLILGGTVGTAFNYTANNNSANIGWFDPLTHPKDYASSVRSAYKKFERARSPKSAKHKFIEYNLNAIYCQDYLPQGGNAFFGLHPDFNWTPGTTLPKQLYMGYTANYNNGICRTLIHSPYGNFTSPMNSLAGNWRRYPWLSDRYTSESFQFDMYLLMREGSTIRDLLLDYTVERSITGGVVIGDIGDAYLNTSYRGVCFPAGIYTKYPSYNDYGRTAGGFSADQVLIGSPWISFPNGITVSNWWASGLAGLCFNPETLVLFNGTTFSNNPPVLSNTVSRPPMTNVVGISFGYGESLLQSLNALSSHYGNSMEFMAYLGCLPYGPGFEMRIPFTLYKDPTVEGNADYFRWRLDASVSHWKEKFKSPVDGFAHVYMDASALIERTYHQWQSPGFTLWTNIAQSGVSYVENIPVAWARDQYNYTFGSSGPNATAGVVLGVERFAQYMFKDDVGLANPSRNDQRRYVGDTEPRHWCLDSDKATDLLPMVHDMFIGQRKWGLTYSNSIWGMGVCGSSELGEIHAKCIVQYMDDSDKSAMSGFPFFYNTFIDVTNSGDIKWKRIPNTLFNGTNDGIPWVNDRRFRLFYLYPAMLALNMSVLDHFHDGVGYYNLYNRSGWFDKSLGNVLEQNMETNGRGSVVSNFPHEGRRTPTKPPQNFWTGIARTSEFELLYACMKGGITAGLDSLYFNELYEELKNGLIDPPNTSRSGFYRALDFAVFGASWTPANTDSNGDSLYPSIVPIIKPPALGPDGNIFTYKGGVDPGSTAGMPVNEFNNNYVVYCNKIPYERRVFLPNYWLLDGPPNQRRNTYYFKRLADGATYTGSATGITFLSTDYGGTWEYGDTSPLKFMTPWAYENRSVAKTSFINFLSQAKNAGLLFKYVHDDCETLGALSPASPIFEPRTESQLITFATSSSTSYNQIPDARHIHAIVYDSRFNGITSSISNRTMAQEFKHNYDQILNVHGFGSCGASAEQILSFFTDATNRTDFRYAYGNGFDVLRIAYAWNATNYLFCQGDLKTKIIGQSLFETPGFENCKVTSSELCVMTPSEGKYAVDLGGHPIVHPHIPGYGHSTHSFGELAGYLNTDYGYPPFDSDDPDIKYGKKLGFHPVSEGGITFNSVPYQAMISDLKRIRGILRSRPEVLSEGLVILINGNPSNGSSIAKFIGPDGNAYFKEHIYHHCLMGVNYFIVFNKDGNMDLTNQALVEWRERSGNTVAIPCDNTGSTANPIDRIDLRQAGTKLVATGAYTNNPDKRLWRLTAPAGVNAFVKVGTNQPLLPDTIEIPNGTRGVWLEAPASYGVPNYTSSTLEYRITVATTGSDTADGITNPVLTIARAMDIASGYTGSLPVFVDVQPGTYDLFDTPVYLNSTHSGTDGSPITIRSVQQDSVIITGAKTLGTADMSQITSADPMYSRFKSSIRNNIYKVPLSDFGILDSGIFGNIRFSYPVIPAVIGVTVDVYDGRKVGFRDVPTLPEVSFNSEPMTLARFPNVGTGPSSGEFSFDSSAIIETVIESGSRFASPGNTLAIFTYPSGVCYGIDYSGISAWASRVGPTSDIFAHGFWRYDWNDESYRISSIDPITRQIEVISKNSAYGVAGTTTCSVNTPSSNPSPRRWFALNIPEELDSPGEYYISRTFDTAGGGDVLYFYPPSGITAGTKLRVSSARLSSGVDWKSGTQSYDSTKVIQTQDPTNVRDTFASLFKMYNADNIVIDGFIFDTCSGSAVEINQCKNVVIKNCKIRNMRKHGVVIMDGESVTIDNCNIRDVGLNGVILTGGDRQTLLEANNTVQNCTIKSWGRLSSSFGSGINLSGVGNKILRNLIADGNGKGINYSGNNHLIEANNFTNLNFYNDDMGAVYKYADPSSAGTIIRGNFFNNIGSKLPGGRYWDACVGNSANWLHNGCAIYLDYSGGGDRIIRNVFYKCGSTLSDVDCAIFIGGTDITINGNIFVECTRPSTFVKFNETNWNNLFTTVGIKHASFNINGDPWLTRDSTIGTADKRYGYTPYSYFDTNYGEPTFTEGNTAYAGLYNKVDIRDETYARTYPKVANLLSIDGATISVNFASGIALNTANNNVCIGTTSGATYAFFEKIYSSGTLYGGFSIGGITFATVQGGSGYFVNYGTNFSLTPFGLNLIKQSLPQFVGISFENIPLYS